MNSHSEISLRAICPVAFLAYPEKDRMPVSHAVTDQPQKRADYSGLIIGLLTLPIFIVAIFADQDELGFAASLAVGMAMFAVRLRWDLRKREWFWAVIVLVLALHAPLLLRLRPVLGHLGSLHGPGLMPIGLADLSIYLGATHVVEKFIVKSTPCQRIRRAFDFLLERGYSLAVVSDSGMSGGVSYRSRALWISIEWDRDDPSMIFTPVGTTAKIYWDTLGTVLPAAAVDPGAGTVERTAPANELAAFLRAHLTEIESLLRPPIAPPTLERLATLDAERARRQRSPAPTESAAM